MMNDEDLEAYAESLERFAAWQDEFDRPDREISASFQSIEEKSKSAFTQWLNNETSRPSTRREEPAPLRPTGDSRVSQLVSAAEERAALSGRFRLYDVVSTPIDEQLLRQVFSRVGMMCNVESRSGRLLWSMFPTRRREILERLVREERLQSSLADELPATDRFGELLREVVRAGDRFSLKSLTENDLSELLLVIEVLEGLRIPLPSPEEIRQSVVRATPFEQHRVLTRYGFVGRAKELRHLRSFLRVTSPRLSVCTMEGMGGAGKSTLLLELATQLIREQIATVVVLDFDRPGINPTDFRWLEAEMSRQIGKQYPVALKRLQNARQTARRLESNYAESLSFGLESTSHSRATSSVLREIQKCLSEMGIRDRPVLIAFDTFEEVVRLSGNKRRFVEWLHLLQDVLFPTPLKVILSGRSIDSPEVGVPSTSIVVDEFEPSVARQLLINCGVPETTAKTLVDSEVLPRRPLELKLLAGIVADNPDFSLLGLEQEIRQVAGTAINGERSPTEQLIAKRSVQQLAVGIIYRRVLNRLKNPITRTLAYPGLVLRYVTPELVREVLAPGLELSITDDQLRIGMDELTSHTWLTSQDGAGRIWHRKDLRRVMLRLLESDMRSLADDISRRAVNFFSRDHAESSWTEAVYHRLMLTRTAEDGRQFEHEDLQRAAGAIGSDIVDLPGAAQALLNYVRFGQISMEDIELLPERYFGSAYRSTGRRLVAAQAFGDALRLYEHAKRMRIRPAPAAEESLWSWETEAVFATARWEELRRLPPPRQPEEDEYSTPLLRLFPQEVVDRTDLTSREIEAAVVGVIDEFGKISKRTSIKRMRRNEQIGTALCRLCMSLLMFDSRIGLSLSLKKLLAFGVARISDVYDRDLSALLQWRLNQLKCAVAAPSKKLVFYPEPAMCRIDPQWFDLVLKYRSIAADKQIFNALRDTQQTLLGILKGRHTTAQRVLTAIDGMNMKGAYRRKLRLEVTPNQNRDLVKLLLRGVDAEFRDPCRYALLDKYRTPNAWSALCKLFTDALPFTIDDLEADHFVERMSQDAEHFLSILVELVDRTGNLGNLMRRAFQSPSPSSLLTDVFRAWKRWDKSLLDVLQR